MGNGRTSFETGERRGSAGREDLAGVGVTGVMERKTALRCSVLWTALTPRV
jgi:hypothetical protein